jgi:hypothetical protein
MIRNRPLGSDVFEGVEGSSVPHDRPSVSARAPTMHGNPQGEGHEQHDQCGHDVCVMPGSARAKTRIL